MNMMRWSLSVLARGSRFVQSNESMNRKTFSASAVSSGGAAQAEKMVITTRLVTHSRRDLESLVLVCIFSLSFAARMHAGCHFDTIERCSLFTLQIGRASC